MTADDGKISLLVEIRAQVGFHVFPVPVATYIVYMLKTMTTFFLRFEGNICRTQCFILQCIGSSDGNSYALQAVAVPVTAVRRAGIRV